MEIINHKTLVLDSGVYNGDTHRQRTFRSYSLGDALRMAFMFSLSIGRCVRKDGVWHVTVKGYKLS